MADASLEKLNLALPPYLGAKDRETLLGQLRNPRAAGYYGEIPGEREPVQGDGWRGFTLFEYPNGTSETVMGLVLSNSCDIAAENEPDADQRIVFAPILDLDGYVSFLEEDGKSSAQIQSTLAAVRNQEITRLFYLPPIFGAQGESVVLLDDVHSQPLSSLNRAATPLDRVFSLSMYGWYMFLMKISIHFTRMHENVPRVVTPGE